MALTAYSIDSCGTTYEYHTTRSQRDRLATPHRSESRPLRHATTHTRRATLESPCRHISLIDSMFAPPPQTRAETLYKRLHRGNPSSISHDPQAGATSVRPVCRLFTRLCHATPSTSPLIVPPYDPPCRYESITQLIKQSIYD